jgi:hypothetical protein
MSTVLSTMLDGLVALALAVVGVTLVAESGDIISLVSRKGFVEICLTLLFSETRLRKGFLDARGDGPRSMAGMSVNSRANGIRRGRQASNSR